MENPRIGFIGFGEAAFHICKGLSTEGMEDIFAFDVMVDDPNKGKPIRERAQTANVTLVSSMEELFQKGDIICCATSAKVALKIAKESLTYVRKDQYYIDLNAASPMVKKDIASLFHATQSHFVDAAVMDAVPAHGHKVPIWVSGEQAKRLKTTLEPYGMNLTVINGEAGSASAIKMFRSIFMKGFTMLLFEALSAGQKYGVEQMLIDSLEKTIHQNTLHELANLLITRTAIHSERRVSEMEEVIQTLENIGLDDSMSLGTRNKLRMLNDLQLNDYFNYEAPNDYRKVLEAVAELMNSC